VESSRAWGAGTALAVVTICLLLPVVALASRPENSGGARLLGDEPIRVALDVLTYLLLIAAILGLLIIVWVLWPRPGEELPPLPRRRRHMATAMALGSAVLIAIWLRAHNLRELPNLPGLAQRGVGAPAVGSSRPLPQTARGAVGPDWIAIAIVAGLVLAAAVLSWRTLRSARIRSSRSPLASLEALLDDAIEDVLAEADPRRAVIAAWARLERVLAGHGLPRRAAEAPFEFALRACLELGIQRVSLERLADLYEWARFSLNEVTPAMREEALNGLLDVRDGLRVAA